MHQNEAKNTLKDFSLFANIEQSFAVGAA